MPSNWYTKSGRIMRPLFVYLLHNLIVLILFFWFLAQSEDSRTGTMTGPFQFVIVLVLPRKVTLLTSVTTSSTASITSLPTKSAMAMSVSSLVLATSR